jgi:hypothetical protein
VLIKFRETTKKYKHVKRPKKRSTPRIMRLARLSFDFESSSIEYFKFDSVNLFEVNCLKINLLSTTI